MAIFKMSQDRGAKQGCAVCPHKGECETHLYEQAILARMVPVQAASHARMGANGDLVRWQECWAKVSDKKVQSETRELRLAFQQKVATAAKRAESIATGKTAMNNETSTLERSQQERNRKAKVLRFLNASWPYIKWACIALMILGLCLVGYERSLSGGALRRVAQAEIWSLTWWRKGVFLLVAISYSWLLLMYGVRKSFAEDLGEEEPEI